MEPVIGKYSDIPIVLLHSSYPYCREAAYLATLYSNIYMDLGLVFPMASKNGQKTILRQALELTPYCKLLFSTDGNRFPEMFWLSLRQFRLALEEVSEVPCIPFNVCLSYSLITWAVGADLLINAYYLRYC
jgi:predicted TIM-barrel fold metal-dependent hydrolase